MSCVSRGALGTALLILVFTAPLQAQDVRKVLVLHSYNTDYQWTRDVDAGIRSALAEGNDGAIIGYTEYLDVRHFRSPEYLAMRASGLASKYAEIDFDGIIVSDDMAFEFMREYRDGLFGSVPLVFAGINGGSPGLLAGFEKVTGVVEGISVSETLAFIYSTFDKEIRLYILADSTTTGQRNLAWVLDELGRADRDPEPQIRIVRNATPNDLRRINGHEKPGGRSAVALLIGALFETDGTSMPFDRAKQLAPELLSAIPIVTMWDFYLGDGILGGRVTRGRIQGQRAGEMMVRIVSGTPVGDIPIVVDSPNEWVFDAGTAKTFGIEPEDLPEGAVFINNEPTLWDLYSEQLIAAGIVFVSLVSVVVVLLITVRQRTESDKKLRESLEEKEVLLQEIHHRVKNNLQVISSILNMQSATLPDGEAVAYFRECESRVRSMALVHEQFYQSKSLKQISMKSYIEELVDSVAELMWPLGALVTLTRDCDDIGLDLDTAIPIGLLLNELVSNAFKYGTAESKLDISVSLTIDAGAANKSAYGRLVVADHGPGLSAPPETGNTLGIPLVKTLADQIGGTVAFEANQPRGLRVVVIFPVPDSASRSDVDGRHRRVFA